MNSKFTVPPSEAIQIEFKKGPTISAPFVFTIIEVSVGIVAACLPTLAPLLKKTPGPSNSVTGRRRIRILHRTRHQSIHLPHFRGYSSSGKRSDSNILAAEESHQVPKATSQVAMGRESNVSSEVEINMYDGISPQGHQGWLSAC